MQIASAFVFGLIFGIGLMVAGMSNPAKVTGFLDLAGAWDPSLALVMVGAIGVGLAGYAIAKGRNTTLLGDALRLPTQREITRSLVLGSAAFGIGWGLAGFCPGPAVVAAGALQPKALLFLVAMLAGLGMQRLLAGRSQDAKGDEPG